MGFLDRAIRKGLSNAVSSVVEKAVSEQLQDGVSQRVQAGAQAIESNMRGIAKDMGLRFCTNCGAAIENGKKFCTNCGTPVPVTAAAAPNAQPSAKQELRESDMPAHFRQIFAEAFADCTVREGLSAQELGWSSEAARPYSFCLYRGSLRCVVMLTEHNRDNNRLFRNARAACEQAGVPFLNFYTHFPNERSYVIDRIRKALG